jgi:hypothetical protein
MYLLTFYLELLQKELRTTLLVALIFFRVSHCLLHLVVDLKIIVNVHVNHILDCLKEIRLGDLLGRHFSNVHLRVPVTRVLADPLPMVLHHERTKTFGLNSVIMTTRDLPPGHVIATIQFGFRTGFWRVRRRRQIPGTGGGGNGIRLSVLRLHLQQLQILIVNLTMSLTNNLNRVFNAVALLAANAAIGVAATLLRLGSKS